MTDREEWFHIRIGKRVFRNDTLCCESCRKIFHKGLIISNEMHADYLYMTECEFNAGGFRLKYFATKKGADGFERKVRERNILHKNTQVKKELKFV